MTVPRPISTLLLLVLLDLRRATATEYFGGSSSVVPSDPAPKHLRSLQQTATPFGTCPASSQCDTTGTLQHHWLDISVGSSVACLAPFGTSTNHTADNTYLRCFPGSLCSTPRIVESVSFRVQLLQGEDIHVGVALYKGTSDGCATDASVGALYAQAPAVGAVAFVQQGIDFTVTVPTPGLTLAPNESVLVELRVPSMAGIGQFFLADTNQGEYQCGPSYLHTTSCGVTSPVPFATAAVGFPHTSYVLSVQTSPGPTLEDPAKSVSAAPVIPAVPPPPTAAPTVASTPTSTPTVTSTLLPSDLPSGPIPPSIFAPTERPTGTFPLIVQVMPSSSDTELPSDLPSQVPSPPPTVTSRVVVATPPPTSAPTTSPATAKPSPSPTSSPTTAKPSPSPTESPTTAKPSPSPTANPTTGKPSPAPTASPTSAKPTPSPTTAKPTPSPTSSPTPLPTTTASNSPTETLPTLAPTQIPVPARFSLPPFFQAAPTTTEAPSTLVGQRQFFGTGAPLDTVIALPPPREAACLQNVGTAVACLLEFFRSPLGGGN